MNNIVHSQQPNFSIPIFLDATRTPQSTLAPPLTSHSACIHSTALLPLTFPSSTPPVPSNLSTSYPTSFSSIQSTHPIDLTQNATRMPIQQRHTLPSSSTPQFSAPPYNITEAMHAFYLPTPSSLSTINETRDIHIRQFSPHALLYNLTPTQLYMQETDYHFQIPALDYTKDHISSRVTEPTNPYDFWFRKIFNFIHLQLNFIKHNKLDFLHLLTPNPSFDQILSFSKLQQCSYENF